MNQLDLPLPKPASTREDEFLVSDSNARAVHALEHWGTWPVMAAILTGPRKSGRSLLGRMFISKTGGALADDAAKISEAELFHAWNRAQAERSPLLIIADFVPPEWPVRLADLRSRLAASQVLRLGAPDDALVPQLIRYLCERRDLDIRPDLIAWLTKRVERSHLTILRVVEALEEAADARRNRRLSIPLARQVLGGTNLVGGSS